MKIITKIRNSQTYARYMYSKTMDSKYIIEFLRRRKGIKIGNNCHIYTWISSPEPYLISIGNNVTISTDVHFITHDNSVCKVLPEFTDIFGKIQIGDDCFIGSNAMILPGVILGGGCVVAAGSVVTKSFGPGLVIGGNPAKIITNVCKYREKIEPYCLNTDGLSFNDKKEMLLNSNKLIKK